MSKVVDFEVVKENKKARESTLYVEDVTFTHIHPENNYTGKIVMADKEINETTTNDNKFLKVKKANNFGSDYYYAERLGVDSVAFILYDSKDGSYGLINEYKPPIDQYMTTAFGGSLDKDISKEQIVKEEVLEEAGYKVENENMKYLGRMFVSTQMNQYCHLYLIDITDSKFVGRQPQNETEASSGVVWFNNKEEIITNLTDWKAITILSKLNNKGE